MDQQPKPYPEWTYKELVAAIRDRNDPQADDELRRRCRSYVRGRYWRGFGRRVTDEVVADAIGEVWEFISSPGRSEGEIKLALERALGRVRRRRLRARDRQTETDQEMARMVRRSWNGQRHAQQVTLAQRTREGARQQPVSYEIATSGDEEKLLLRRLVESLGPVIRAEMWRVFRLLSARDREVLVGFYELPVARTKPPSGREACSATVSQARKHLNRALEEQIQASLPAASASERQSLEEVLRIVQGDLLPTLLDRLASQSAERRRERGGPSPAGEGPQLRPSIPAR